MVARSTQPLGLMLYDFRSEAWSRIANDSYVGAVSWSADGRYLFTSGSDSTILRIRSPMERSSKSQISSESNKPVSVADFGWT